MPQIYKNYIETNKIKYIVFDFPLKMHEKALKAAEVSRCAGEQGRFWEMRERLFANESNLDQWAIQADAAGVDFSRFEECLKSGRQQIEIQKDIAEAKKTGVNSTPTFLLGYVDSNGLAVNILTRLTGAKPFDIFEASIEKLLAEQDK
jgi:protein-disulfide isomerase